MKRVWNKLVVLGIVAFAMLFLAPTTLETPTGENKVTIGLSAAQAAKIPTINKTSVTLKDKKVTLRKVNMTNRLATNRIFGRWPIFFR